MKTNDKISGLRMNCQSVGLINFVQLLENCLFNRSCKWKWIGNISTITLGWQILMWQKIFNLNTWRTANGGCRQFWNKNNIVQCLHRLPNKSTVLQEDRIMKAKKEQKIRTKKNTNEWMAQTLNALPHDDRIIFEPVTEIQTETEPNRDQFVNEFPETCLNISMALLLLFIQHSRIVTGGA